MVSPVSVSRIVYLELGHKTDIWVHIEAVVYEASIDLLFTLYNEDLVQKLIKNIDISDLYSDNEIYDVLITIFDTLCNMYVPYPHTYQDSICDDIPFTLENLMLRRGCAQNYDMYYEHIEPNGVGKITKENGRFLFEFTDIPILT
jgi:hypothetical protein